MMRYKFLENIKLKVKNKKDFLLAPFTELLYMTNISPNAITIFSAVSGVTAATALFYDRNIFLLLILLHFLLDNFDGSLARRKKIKPESGWLLDYLSDRIVMAAVMLSTYAVFSKEIPAAANRLMMVFFIFYLIYSLVYIYKKKDRQLLYYEPFFYLLVYLGDITLGIYFGLAGSFINTVILLRPVSKIKLT